MTEDKMMATSITQPGIWRANSISRYIRVLGVMGVIFLLLGFSACSKHQVPTVTKVTPASTSATLVADTLKAATLADSLIGIWKIRKTEIDNAMDKMTTYGSQTERDEMLKKQAQYQEAFLGLTTTFKADNSFQSVFSGQSDVGTWRVTRQREIETISRVTDNASVFKIRSITNTNLTVNYDAAGVLLVLTFDRQ